MALFSGSSQIVPRKMVAELFVDDEVFCGDRIRQFLVSVGIDYIRNLTLI